MPQEGFVVEYMEVLIGELFLSYSSGGDPKGPGSLCFFYHKGEFVIGVLVKFGCGEDSPEG